MRVWVSNHGPYFFASLSVLFEYFVLIVMGLCWSIWPAASSNLGNAFVLKQSRFDEKYPSLLGVGKSYHTDN